MKACLTKFEPSQLEGLRSDGSSYPESESAYFKRVYGSDHLKQLHDDRQKRFILESVLPSKRKQLIHIMNRLSSLKCENDPGMTQPGRSAYSLNLLAENLQLYTRKQVRSLRWNQHYQQALSSVADDVFKLLNKGEYLKPMTIESVASSAPIQKNLDKNAGFFAFLTDKRSKGENLDEAVKWCNQEKERIYKNGYYNIPLVISHRSSNSKPTSNTTWKWRCRIILMQDIRALLLDGRFAVPFTQLFIDIPWGEGGMNQSQVRDWVAITRRHYDSYYSSDYSKFDVSQPAWLLEDVFNSVIRPLFGSLSESDECAFKAMVYSYIHKEIHYWNGSIWVDACQVSGSLMTYAINTVVNEIIDRTSILMQRCDLSQFKSLKCGDDNLTYYNSCEPWNREEHCRIIQDYFGIKTTLEPKDCGPSSQDPTFLSKIWTDNGEERDIHEVIFNLLYPERFRNYDSAVTGVSERRAVALVLQSSCEEQEATMREWFDLDYVADIAGIKRHNVLDTYKALAAMGTGFRTSWLNFKFDNLRLKRTG